MATLLDKMKIATEHPDDCTCEVCAHVDNVFENVKADDALTLVGIVCAEEASARGGEVNAIVDAVEQLEKYSKALDDVYEAGIAEGLSEDEISKRIDQALGDEGGRDVPGTD